MTVCAAGSWVCVLAGTGTALSSGDRHRGRMLDLPWCEAGDPASRMSGLQQRDGLGLRLQWVDRDQWRMSGSGRPNLKGCFQAMNSGRRPANPDPNQPDEMKVSSAGSRRWRRSVRTAARRPRQAESTPQGRCAPCLRRRTRWHLYAGRMTPHFAARAARFVAAGLHASEIRGRPARASTKPTISPSTTVPSGSTTGCAARRRR